MHRKLAPRLDYIMTPLDIHLHELTIASYMINIIPSHFDKIPLALILSIISFSGVAGYA